MMGKQNPSFVNGHSFQPDYQSNDNGTSMTTLGSLCVMQRRTQCARSPVSLMRMMSPKIHHWLRDGRYWLPRKLNRLRNRRSQPIRDRQRAQKQLKIGFSPYRSLNFKFSCLQNVYKYVTNMLESYQS